MRDIYVFGAGKIGKTACFYLRDTYKICAVLDNDTNKQGKELDGIPIVSPCVLNDRKLKVIIATNSWREIKEQLVTEYQLDEIDVFELTITDIYSSINEEDLRGRTIDLGSFLYKNKTLFCKELTFISGGSGVLDYALLKSLVLKFGFKSYFEIGTYIGESINVLTDDVERLYSLTAPLDAPYSMSSWCKSNNMPDYSDRLAQNRKIRHYYANSLEFDFTQLPKDIDLFFIDGDHSYNGVYSDTKNIFAIRKNNSIVVWHDFKYARNQINRDVVIAVKDAIGEKEFKNVFVTDNNLCGIYLPDEYKDAFSLVDCNYDSKQEHKLYVYDTQLDVHIK